MTARHAVPRRWLSLAVLAVVLLAGCAAEPSPSAAVAADRPVACIDLEPARCEVAVAATGSHLADSSPTYVAVARRSCDGGCRGEERGVWLGHVTVEFADGRPAATILIEVDGQDVQWEPIETVLHRVDPASGRVVGPIVDLTLGHCGLNSPIDLDGSLWDPVGVIDPSHPDLVNAASGTISFSSPTTAVLRTVGGAVVELVRHAGPRHYPGCD